jgi:methylmalonyl-CoA carboxyltransferase large subunit
MRENRTDQRLLEQAVDELRAEVSRLSRRLAAVEQTVHIDRDPRPSELAADPGIDEDLICVISAAVAAYLGVKPHIRQVRLAGGASWAQQGRVTIQASHVLAVRHE